MKPGVSRTPRTSTTGSENARIPEKNEVLYPFGVQNDLGHVVLTRNSKQSSREDGRGDGCPGPPSPPLSCQTPPSGGGGGGVFLLQNPPLSPNLPPQPPEPELLSPRVLTGSVSHLSLQSTRHNSVASSLSDLSYDVAILERALRTNDVNRVRKSFEKHRHRFQLIDKSIGDSDTQIQPAAGPSTSTSSARTKSRPSEVPTEPEENPVVFTNALHLAVEWGANDCLRYLLRENVDPNKPGRLPDVLDISVAGSRSASVSAWGSGCVFCPPSPRALSRDVSPSREISKVFSRNSSRNVSSESSRCVSPCKERIWGIRPGPQLPQESSAHLRREAFKHVTTAIRPDDVSSNGESHGEPVSHPHSSDIRPIISVVYCPSEERRRSSCARPPGEILLPSGYDPDEWTPGGLQQKSRGLNRRVSWVSSLREPSDKNRMNLTSRLKKTKLRLPRQRSFSLESELELRAGAKRAVGVAGAIASIRDARRSISLKSSPLHFPWTFRRESSTAAAMREGGVFAELRRSSEIFRNILLSIAGREESTPTDDDQYDMEGKDLSFSSLLAAHGRRRSERSVSYSSCSWSDVSIGSETMCRKPLAVNPAISKGLLVVAVEPKGREITFVEHYTSMQFMQLPPIFLAASRGRSTPVALLLQFGAKADITDSMLNTPLHLAAIQSPTPWDTILDLMEASGRVSARNERGISPLELLPPLGRLQKQLIADCWLSFILEDAQSNDQNEQGARESGSRSSRLFKKLHDARYHREKGEGRSSIVKSNFTGVKTSTGASGQGTAGQGPQSEVSEVFSTFEEPSTQKYKPDECQSDTKQRKIKRQKKEKPSKPHVEPDPAKMEWAELGRCLVTLKCLAANEECLDEVLAGLTAHSASLLRRFQQVPPASELPADPHQCLSSLLHTILAVSVKCHSGREDSKRWLTDVCCTLSKACLVFASGPHPLQYTAMMALNKVIDTSVAYRLTAECRELEGLRSMGGSPSVFGGHHNLEAPPSHLYHRGSSFGSISAQKIKNPAISKSSKFKEPPAKNLALGGDIFGSEDILDILGPAVGAIVNILHNAVTLYKRTIGSRQICTPSVRKRSCSAHCLQLLSARILVFLASSPAVQSALVAEAPLRIFIAALDATHDPQLLCLVLQILATLAIEPAHHKPLIDAGVADVLPPLLLPADEFFYTNHTTLFPRYVKHHAARLLVYLGLHHRLALRVSVFDLITSEDSTFTSGSLGNDDLFITWTCSTPPPVLGVPSAGAGNLPPVIAMSVESTLLRVIKSLEVTMGAPGSPYLREPQCGGWGSPNRASFSQPGAALPIRRHSAETGRRDSIGGPELDANFVRIFQTCFASIVHPTILLRLLLHRLLTTGLALRRWKSCASRASFASAYSGHSGHSIFSFFSGETRTSRSRASSTDTGGDSLPLRRRRQVSLTVDCGPGGSLNEGEESLALQELDETRNDSPPDNNQKSEFGIPSTGATLAPQHPPSPPSGAGSRKSSTLRGIFTKWRSSSQEASVDKSEAGKIESQSLQEKEKLNIEGQPKTRESSIFGLLPLASLRSSTSHESLGPGHDGDRSGQNSATGSPTGSPGFLAKQSFRFGSLHHRKSSARRLSRNRSLDVSTETDNTLKEKPEDEILAFQRKLQNLPDFLDSSIEPPSPPPVLREPRSPTGTGPRPRSRSVPKVTLEAPISASGSTGSPPVMSPTLPIPTTSTHLLSPSSPVRGCPSVSLGMTMTLPTMSSGGQSSPRLLSPHSPSKTFLASGGSSQNSGDGSRNNSPFEDKGSGGNNSGGSGVSDLRHLLQEDRGGGSRRSSVSPASYMSGGGKRHDSIFISDMPAIHRAVLLFVEDWITIYKPSGKNTVIRELKDFVARVSSCGPPYLRWADHIRILCPSLNVEDDANEHESLDDIANEYWEMQRLVLSGNLPCSKEEAAVLAGMQMRLEECWPRARPPKIVGPLPSPAPALPITPNLNTRDEPESKESSLTPLLTESPAHGRYGTGDGAEDTFTENVGILIENVAVKKSSGMSRAVSLFTNCVGSSGESEIVSNSSRIEDLVPPCYIHAGNMPRLIKEQKRKLFHTSVYDSATQLQKLYVQSCRRLPAYGCRLVLVKELLRGKTKKKATRYLGIGTEKIILLDTRTKILSRSQPTVDLIQWRAGGGRNHDRLLLEFRGAKWTLLVPSLGPSGSGSGAGGVSCGHLGTVGGLREAGRALWALLRDMDSNFLDDFISGPPIKKQTPPTFSSVDAAKKRWKVKSTVSPELEALEKVLHFPEEVAIALADTESQLFCQVAPLEYLRHVTMELNSQLPSGGSGPNPDPSLETLPQPNQLPVSALIDRFNEISSWVTHLLVSPPTHDERKAMLSCLLRVVRTAWNLGAFGTAVEILAGLKSSKLKPFWLSVLEKDEIPTMELVSKALLGQKAADTTTSGQGQPGGPNGGPSPSAAELWNSVEYESALSRALKIGTCPIVPFFGAYLKELCGILSSPSLIVLNSASEQQYLQVLAGPHGEDDFFTKIGPGGLLNMNKLRKVQAILEKISLVHQHHAKRHQRVAFLHADRLSIHTSSIERAGFPEELDSSFDIHDDLFSGHVDPTEELNVYQPVQKLTHEPLVSFIPLEPGRAGQTWSSVDLHELQILHHGATALHVDSDGRSALVWVKLERSCGTIIWSKPVWSSLRFAGHSPQADFDLGIDPESLQVPPGLMLKHTGGGGPGGGGGGGGSQGVGGLGGCPDIAGIGLEEGFIDLGGVKEVEAGGRDFDTATAMKRFGIESWKVPDTCISLVFGTILSDNRSTVFIFAPKTASAWLSGLKAVVKSLRRVLGKPDRRYFWLKEQYLQLYFEDGRCLTPTMADAIRVFGGRKWSSSAPQGMAPETPSLIKRTTSVKFRKKRSLANIHMIKEYVSGSGGDFRPSSPAMRSKTDGGDLGQSSSPSTPPPPQHHGHHGQSLTRIKSALSMSMSPSTGAGNSNLPQSPMGGESTPSPQARVSALTHETRLTFPNFVSLFQAFSLRSRKDLRDLFDSIATTQKSETAAGSPLTESPSSSASGTTAGRGQGGKGSTTSGGKPESKFIYDAIASASIVTNGAGVETSRSRILQLSSFANFIKVQQGEKKSDQEVKAIIEKFEPDESLRTQHSLSFEGFAQYLMSGANLAFVSERIVPQEEELDHPFSHYYVAASHNTYLTGHQLKGESSVELYSQLDCWDGDDGDPVIYHGHTFTTKISFRQVVEAINKSAFLASSYPVILSIENHCSLQQQARMAWIFQTTFGEKLVTRFIFESDFTDDPCLPSPSQLKNRILIKNKKFHAEIVPNPASNIHQTAPVPVAQSVGSGRTRSGSRPQSARTNSIISQVSGGSINDDFSDDDVESDYEDEIPDERLVVSRQQSEQALPITPRTDSLTSQESSLKSSTKRQQSIPAHSTITSSSNTQTTALSNIASQYQNDQGDWIVELEDSIPKKKQSSQIARELSDLVIYIQAIKFRGLNTLSPSSSVRNKIMSKKNILPSSIPSGPMVSLTSLPVTPTSSSVMSTGTGTQPLSSQIGTIGPCLVAPDHGHGGPRRVISNHPVYQCSSINENAAKKLCRKQALQVLAHTETQLIRAYPAGMRIDSSNFNPLIFWAFGIQMIALNYQTEDIALHLNAAMFEQNGRCGYVLKPPVMWDRNNVMYRRFNPLEKEFDGLHKVHLNLTVISGQFLSPINYGASPQVEVEITGIPVDCVKQKTRIIPRNALNPIWSESLSFTVHFKELAFLRFTVIDGGPGGSGSGHLLAQRVIPLKGLKEGYRHLRLRNSHNQPLPVSTLFIHTKQEEECEAVEGVSSGPPGSQMRDDFFQMHSGSIPEGIIASVGGSQSKTPSGLKRRMFFLVVYGVVSDEPYTILKVTQDTCASEVISNALQKSGRSGESSRDYVLIEEVGRGWDAKDRDLPPTQRVLELSEKPLQAQSQWKGEGKFILKKTGTDPSSRAWLSSISARGGRHGHGGQGGDGTSGGTSGGHDDDLRQWGEDDNFLVCVHNVSPEIPYAILKVPVKSSAQDIIAQAFVKARRLEDPVKFVLVEELEPISASVGYGGSSGEIGGSFKKRSLKSSVRALVDDENVYEAQLKWSTVGKFILRERKQIHTICGISTTHFPPSQQQPGGSGTQYSSSTASTSVDKGTRLKSVSGIRVSTLARLSKLRIHRNTNGNTKSSTRGAEKARRFLTERHAQSLHETSSGSAGVKPRPSRAAHSEGETLTDDEPHGDGAGLVTEEHSGDLRGTVARFKKVSIQKFKSWKS